MAENNKQNADVNHQDHPHQEGQQNNIAPKGQAQGQRRSDNNGQAMNNMKNQGNEQQTGSQSAADGDNVTRSGTE